MFCVRLSVCVMGGVVGGVIGSWQSDEEWFSSFEHFLMLIFACYIYAIYKYAIYKYAIYIYAIYKYAIYKYAIYIYIYIVVGWTFWLLEGLPTSLTRENLSKMIKLTTKLLLSFGTKIKKNKAHYHLVCEAVQSLWSKVCTGAIK